jgi:hypothetical protein
MCNNVLNAAPPRRRLRRVRKHAHDDAVVRLARAPGADVPPAHVVQERECVPDEHALAEGGEHQAAVARVRVRRSAGRQKRRSTGAKGRQA